MMSYLRSALAILNLMASYSRGEVKQFFTIRIKNAYPFYLLGYEKKLTAIFDYFKQLPGLVLAGRTEELTSIWILINVWRTRLNCDKTF